MERIPSGSGDGPRLPNVVGKRGDSYAPDPDQALWRKFAEAATPKAFCQSWLALQCRMLAGIRCALVLLGPSDRGPFTPAAVWPTPKFSVSHLTPAAERALKERRGLFIQNDSTHIPETPLPEGYQVAYPIEVSGKLHGVVVLEIEERPRHEVQAIMRQLHWGAAWLKLMYLWNNALKSSNMNERLQTALDLVASGVEHERFHPAAMAFVTRLATSLDCDRVSLGFVDGKHVNVSALSHSAEFGKQMNLVRAIGSAMDEAIDQEAVVVYPLPSDAAPLVTRAHAELARQHGAGTICTIPLENKGKLLGGLTLERPADRVFDQATVELCETVAALVAPILDGKRAEDRWLITKAGESFVAQLRKLFGPGHLMLKLIALMLVALVAFFSFAMADYRVTATTSLEGAVQRVVAAPFNGYVSEASARAGDLVREGELLCLLDDRDLKLERVKWSTQRNQLVKEYREAMAKHDRAQIEIIRAKINQAKAQLSLLDEQLARTKVIAPFDAVVISGDLSQSLGAPVERGQVLFEVAPLDAYRLIVEVDEREIADVAVGQTGELVLPSVPDEVFPFVVDKITPVSIAKEGRNYFRVEARLKETSGRLRPGMEGVGKISIDRRKLIWIWTHEMIDWVRLKLWTWIP